MKQKEHTFAATTWVMSLVNSVEHRAPNICASLQTSVPSGFVSSGITLEKSIRTPSKTSERSRGMIRYAYMYKKPHGTRNESGIQSRHMPSYY